MWRRTTLPKLQAAKEAHSSASKSWKQVDRALQRSDSSMMEHALKDFETRVEEARRRMQQAVVEDKQVARTWCELKYKVKISTWYVLLQRHRSEPFLDLIDNKSKRVTAELSSIQPKFLPDERSHAALSEVFATHAGKLCELYEFYCSLPDSRWAQQEQLNHKELKEMSVEQLLRLLKDSKLITLDLLSTDIARALCGRFCKPGETFLMKTFVLILVGVSDLVVGYGNWSTKTDSMLQTKVFLNSPAKALEAFRSQLCASNWRVHFDHVRRCLYKQETGFVEVSVVRRRLIGAHCLKKNSGKRMPDSCITETEFEALLKSLSLNTSGYLSCEECTELLFAIFLACFPDENLLSSSQLSSFMRLVCDGR